MFDEEYIIKLLDYCNNKDPKIIYIKKKYEKRGIDKLSLSEYNYIRRINNLKELEIQNLKKCLYENMISYSDLETKTKISRSMMCMILRGTRNCTILQLKKILNYLDKLNINFTF